MFAKIGLHNNRGYIEYDDNIWLQPLTDPRDYKKGIAKIPGLRGDHWAGVNFYFKNDGSLDYIEIQGG
jgi:hypothetical protein